MTQSDINLIIALHKIYIVVPCSLLISAAHIAYDIHSHKQAYIVYIYVCVYKKKYLINCRAGNYKTTIYSRNFLDATTNK